MLLKIIFLKYNNLYYLIIIMGDGKMTKRILIADDAAFMRRVLKDMLSKHGFEVVGEAQNGVEAVVKYKELKPDLVTLDITMPEKDGIQALKEIISFDKNAKIIMMSAMGQEAFVKEAVLNGAKDFIVKPFKEDMVIQRISNLFEN
jgi:two-component system chemotaxis response regulator CheY